MSLDHVLCYKPHAMTKPKIRGDVLEVLEENETFLISSHINPDGDAVGSQLAFYSLLSDLGKKVFVVNSDPVPFAYSFLPGVSVLQCINSGSNGGQRSIPELSFQSFDVAIILDCGDLERIGKELAEHVHTGRVLINIDHHHGNKRFGTHNLVDDRACATGEIIFDLMEYGGMEISQDQAVCLYTAILTDTGCFKYSNTSARAHTITARLIDKGVQPDRIAEAVYETIPYQRAKLLGMALEALKISSDGKIVWTSVTRKMYEKTGATSEDTEGIIEYVRSLRGVEVAMLFRELENGDTKASLRSKQGLDVQQVAAMFGGGGHKAAAGCIISEPLEKAINIVLEALKKVREPIAHH